MADLEALALARAQAVEDLETAIAQLGAACRRYNQLTQQLGESVGADLTRRLEVPIILKMNKAGLPFLERKLHGDAAPLRALVEEQHERLMLTTR